MFRKNNWKTIAVTAMVIALAMVMTACGKVEVTAYNMDETEVANAILENVKFDSQLYQVKDNQLSYFIPSDECVNRLMFMGNGTFADSFGIFTVPTEDVDYATLGDEMYEKVQTYITELIDSYKGYFPVEAAKIELAYVEHFGQYVVFCVTSDYEKAQSVVESLVQSTIVEMDKDAYEAATKLSDIATFTSTAKDIVLDDYPAITNTGEYVDKGAVFSIGDSGYEAYTYVESTAGAYAKTMNNVADALKGTATMYDVLIPLGSGIVLPDDYYDKVRSSNQRSAMDSIIAKLDRNVNVVDPYDNLMMHRNEYIYYRTDHHWTQLGAYYAYEKLCEKMDVLPISLSRHDTVEFPGFLGTFYNDMGHPEDMKANADTIKAYYPISKNSKLEYSPTKNQTIPWKIINDVSSYPSYIKYSTFIAGDNPYTYIENPDLADGSAAIVVKESFGNSLVPFLVDHYHKLYVIDYRYWEGNIVDLANEVKADDVIFLNNLSMTRNSYLVGKIAQMVE